MTAVVPLKLVDSYPVRDTAVHNPFTATGATPDSNYFYLEPLGDEFPEVDAELIWVLSTLNQGLSIQVIGDLDPNESWYSAFTTPPPYSPFTPPPSTQTALQNLPPPWVIGSAQAIGTGPATIGIAIDFEDLPTEAIALQVQAATAPASGLLWAMLLLYRLD